MGCFRSKKGKLLFEENFASYSNMLQWALSFGDRVEILEPEELIKDTKTQKQKRNMTYSCPVSLVYWRY